MEHSRYSVDEQCASFCFQALGVFGLCQIHAFVDYLRSRMSQDEFNYLFKVLIITTVGIVLTAGGIATFTGNIYLHTGRPVTS